MNEDQRRPSPDLWAQVSLAVSAVPEKGMGLFENGFLINCGREGALKIKKF